MPEDVLFEEVQRVAKTPVIIMPISMVGLSGWAVVSQLILDIPVGGVDASPASLGMAFVGSCVILALFLQFGLVTRVTRERLTLHYTPTAERPVLAVDIIAVRQMPYDPIKKFGWGRKGNSWTVSGRKAVEITRRGGETMVIGTRRPEELEAALKSVAHGEGRGHGQDEVKNPK